MKKTILLFSICAIAMANAAAQAVFRVSPGTEMLVNNGVKIVLNNTSFENNGSLGLGTTSRFVFTGNSPVVTISGTGNTVLSELELNKTAGVVQLNRTVSIFTGVFFTSGNLDLNGNMLFLLADPNGQLIGENNNSRIIGNTGFVRKPATLNAPAGVNPGNIGLLITSAQNLGATTIERYHYSVNNQNVRRVFHINPANNNNLNATLEFRYLDAELNAIDENTLNLWRSANGSGGWASAGGIANAAQNSVTLNGLNDLSWFTPASSNAALPIILASFTATCANNQVVLNWQTKQEQNTNRFEVQSSIGGSIWTTLASVNATGNSSTPVDYSYNDISSGRKFYRLRIVDNDGSFTLSPVQTVDCSDKKWTITALPNPVRDNLELVLNGINRHSIKVEMVNALGQMVWQQQVSLTNQYRRIAIPVQQLVSGSYFIHINEPEYQQTIPIIKQ